MFARSLLSICLVCALWPVASYGTIIISHVGSADPATEGWVAPVSGCVVVGPVYNDRGLDAWSVNDTSTVSGSGTAVYRFVPSAAVISAVLSGGWKLSAQLRVVNAPENPDRASFVDFIDGATRWRMDFGADTSGDPIVLLQDGVDENGNDTGTPFTLVGGGNGYHLYQLIYDPASATVDLFVDGSERVSNFAGMTTAITRIAFGAGQEAQTGNVNFNLVQLIPEPATLSLLALGGLAMMRRRRK